MKEALSAGPFGKHLRISRELHPAILRRCARRICPDIGFERLNAIEELMLAPRGRTELPGGMIAERGHRGIYFLPKHSPVIPDAPLNLDGKTRLPGIARIAARPWGNQILRDDPLRQALDAEALEGAVMRLRRVGDRIRPLNCGGKLLSDYLTDRRIDRPIRDCLPLIARGQDVLWVCGVGISSDAALRPVTRRAVLLECQLDFDMDFLR